MATSDIELQQVEVLWARFKERLAEDPHAQIDQFAADYPELAEEICRVFPVMRELECLSTDSPEEHDAVLPESIGRYPIVRRIGFGGMGVVYEAQCDALRERIAIKVISSGRLDPKNIQRFEQEARAVASLHHTNIVPIYEFGQEEGKHFYTMRLVDGPNLAEVTRLAELNEHDELSEFESTDARAYQLLARLSGNWALIAELGAQAAMALEHAHSKEVLHRDIKPANLLVDGTDKLWITDFGLAKRVLADNELTSIFQTVGTPRYMAPEQAKGLADHRSDIYSLGLTLYELVTLQCDKPRARTPSFTLPASPRSINPNVPVALDSAIMQAIQIDPADRFQSAHAFGQALQSSAEKALQDASRGRQPLWAILITAVAIAALFLFPYMSFFGQDASPLNQTWSVSEGATTVGEFPTGFGDLENWELEGDDSEHFELHADTNALRFVQPLNFEVPVDQDMDNVYQLQLVNRKQGTTHRLKVHMQDVNEPPSIDEYIFLQDGQTIRLTPNQIGGAWMIDVRDDHDDLFDGLFFALGGEDQNLVKMTPQGVFVFDPKLRAGKKIDANKDGTLEIDLTVADATDVWLARLEQRDGGKLALIRERIVLGAKLESEVLIADCLIRRDVIDIASADGQTFFHIHAEDAGGLSLYRSRRTDQGSLASELLSEDCGLPRETIGLSTLDGKHFMAILRKRGEPTATTVLQAELMEDGTFQTATLSDASGIPISANGFAWIDPGRFHHIRRSPTGQGFLYFSFLGQQQFTNMRLSESEPQYEVVNRGLAAWVGREVDSCSIARPLRFELQQ